MKKYLFVIFVAFFFSGCDDTDEIIKRANQANQRSQAEINRLVAINRRQEQENRKKIERIEREKRSILKQNIELKESISDLIDTIKDLKQEIKLLEEKKNLLNKDAMLKEIDTKMSFLKRCIEKRQQLGIGDTSSGLDYTKSEINQYKNQLRNKTYGIRFDPPKDCLLAYTLENIKTNEISIKYITKQNINDYAALRSKMIGDVCEDKNQILDISCVGAIGLFFLEDWEDNTICSYLVSSISEPNMGLITPNTPVGKQLLKMEKDYEIFIFDREYHLVDKIMRSI